MYRFSPTVTLALSSLLSSTAVWAVDLNKQLTLEGLVEVEASYLVPETGDSTSDLRVATVELGLTAQVNAWVAATMALLYEQDETDLEVDIAQIVIGNAERAPWSLTAGQYYLPFGSYETQLVSDPLTLELGETRSTALQIGFEQHGVRAGIYAFNGTHAHSDDDSDTDDDNQIDRWGAHVGFNHARATDPTRRWSVSLGYLSDLGDSDSLEDVIVSDDSTAGWTVATAATFGPVQVSGEYLAAAERFDVATFAHRERGARPQTWTVETGYHFRWLGVEQVVAVSYQGSDEALALELPERRWLLGWSADVFTQTTLALEWAHDSDYGRADGGSGDSANSLVAQLAVSF